MTALKEGHSHTPLICGTLEYKNQCFLSFLTSVKSKMLLEARVAFVQVGVAVERTKCRSNSRCPGIARQKELKAQIKLLKIEEGNSEGKEKQHIHREDIFGDLGAED